MNNSRSSKRLALIGALASALLLGACEQSAPSPAPSPEPSENPVDTGEQASIIRPDIEIARTQDVEPLEATIGFGEGGADLSDEALAALREALDSPQIAEFDGRIILRGHSDAGGNDAVNLRMSQDRADAVKDWLVENGVNEERIATIAFGEQNPVAPNALPDGEPNEEGRAANRRVEMSVAVPRGATVPTPAEPTAPAATPSSDAGAAAEAS